MITLVRRLWFLFVVALKLSKTDSDCKNLGPLVNAIRLKCSILNFSEEEKRTIERCNGDFPVIAGVRRQASFTILYLMRCTVVYSNNKNKSEKQKMISDALCNILVNRVLEEGHELDGKVAFEAKHSELLAKEPDHTFL